MAIHCTVDTEEYVTVNDEFMKAVFCDGLLRDVHGRDANSDSFGEGTAEVEVFDI